MAGIAKKDVAKLLSACEQAGILRAWRLKPLGVFELWEWDGDHWTSVAREAALWAQGALSGHYHLVNEMELVPEDSYERVAEAKEAGELLEDAGASPQTPPSHPSTAEEDATAAGQSFLSTFIDQYTAMLSLACSTNGVPLDRAQSALRAVLLALTGPPENLLPSTLTEDTAAAALGYQLTKVGFTALEPYGGPVECAPLARAYWALVSHFRDDLSATLLAGLDQLITPPRLLRSSYGQPTVPRQRGSRARGRASGRR